MERIFLMIPGTACSLYEGRTVPAIPAAVNFAYTV